MSEIKLITWPQVVLFGDSITQTGEDKPPKYDTQTMAAMLQINSLTIIMHKLPNYDSVRLVRKCDVVNRGLSGYNTRWAKLVLPRIVPNHGASHPPIAAVTVFFGANDSSLEDKNPQQHIPCEEYSKNLRDIVKYLASAGVPNDKIIFITPPPIQEALWEKECQLKGCSLNRLNSVTGQYAQYVVDLWSLMQKDGEDFSAYLSDGLHLSEKGNQFVAEHVWSLLESKVSDLPFILPYWADVDCKNPENSLLCD